MKRALGITAIVAPVLGLGMVYWASLAREAHPEAACALSAIAICCFAVPLCCVALYAVLDILTED